MPTRRSRSRDDQPVVLTDPAEVRALAHPARLTVIDLLYSGDVLTATELAERAGITPSAMSYHLRALERAGIVRRAEPRDDARQRPWCRAGSDLEIRLSGDRATASRAAATELLLEASMAVDRRRLVAHAARDKQADGPWRGVATYDRRQLVMTADETRALIAEVAELVAPFTVEARPDAPEGGERVAFVVTVVREDADR